MAAEDDSRKDDVVATELPAPAGWAKKIIPKKSGTPQRSEVVFVSPTGEEIKTKRQLDQYLKSHPGGAAASEFDWAAGDTPRRSARLSEKSKAVETSAIQSSTKKQKRSTTKRGTANEKSNANDAEGEVIADKDDTADKEPKENPDAEITDAKDTVEEGEPVVTDQTPLEKPDVEKKAAETEPPTDDAKSNAKESNETTNTDTKIEDFNNIKNIEEAEEATPGTYAKIEDSNNIKIVEEVKETTPSTENHESKDAVHIEKKTPVETSDTKEKQVDNNDKDLVFQESGTGN